MSSLLSYDIDTGLDTYRLLVNSIEDYAIILLDIYGVVKIWNKGAEAIKGYKAEEIIGQNFEILYSADDRDKKTPSKNLEDTLRLGHIRYEGWRMRRDGSLFWAHVSITALYDRDKKLVGFSKITSDLTEKHNAQAEKEKEHEILDIIHHTAHIGGWELDVARQKITWSSVTCEIHEVPEGFQPTLAEAISFYKEGDSRDIIQKIYQEAVANGTAYDVDLPVITATGREIWCRSIGQAEIRDGRCVRLYGTFQDIDQQKRTQIELQLSEERFRNAFDLSAIGMALVSVEAVPIRVNKRLSELLGYTCEEFYAMTVFDFTHPDDIPADKAYAQQLLNGEIDHYRMVKRYFHKNGNTVWSHITVSLVRDAQHIPVHFVSEVEDIGPDRHHHPFQ
jgi:PAS domain S-box-containing protein